MVDTSKRPAPVSVCGLCCYRGGRVTGVEFEAVGTGGDGGGWPRDVTGLACPRAIHNPDTRWYILPSYVSLSLFLPLALAHSLSHSVSTSPGRPGELQARLLSYARFACMPSASTSVPSNLSRPSALSIHIPKSLSLFLYINSLVYIQIFWFMSIYICPQSRVHNYVDIRKAVGVLFRFTACRPSVITEREGEGEREAKESYYPSHMEDRENPNQMSLLRTFDRWGNIPTKSTKK